LALQLIVTLENVFIFSQAYNCTSNTSVILFEMQSFGNDPIKTAAF